MNREAAILSLTPQVASITRRLFVRAAVDREDILSEAWIGAIEAVDGFDPRAGAKLQTYAYCRIAGRILDYFRRMNPGTRKRRDGNKTAPAPPLAMIPLGDFDRADGREVSIAQFEAGHDACRLFELAPLSSQERLVIKRLYFDHAAQREIAKDLGVHESYVPQIRDKALFKMRLASSPSLAPHPATTIDPAAWSVVP